MDDVLATNRDAQLCRWTPSFRGLATPLVLLSPLVCGALVSSALPLQRPWGSSGSPLHPAVVVGDFVPRPATRNQQPANRALALAAQASALFLLLEQPLAPRVLPSVALCPLIPRVALTQRAETRDPRTEEERN